jgi:predicted RNase H-like nuclease (RuvC/YqgF family)
MTDGEKIHELERIVHTLVERVDNARDEIRDLAERMKGVAELTTRVALLEQQLTDLRQRQKSWWNSFWVLVAALVSGVVGAVVSRYLPPLQP